MQFFLSDHHRGRTLDLPIKSYAETLTYMAKYRDPWLTGRSSNMTFRATSCSKKQVTTAYDATLQSARGKVNSTSCPTHAGSRLFRHEVGLQMDVPLIVVHFDPPSMWRLKQISKESDTHMANVSLTVLRVLAVFFGGQDHRTHLIERITDGKF